jgi:hypothetical protein
MPDAVVDVSRLFIELGCVIVGLAVLARAELIGQFSSAISS